MQFFKHCFIPVILFSSLPIFTNQALANEKGQSPPIKTIERLNSGDWHDQLRFDIGPGLSPLEPEISIVHQKGSRVGALGLGYKLNAQIDVISQQSETGGVPGHTDDDVFYLNGIVLIPDSSNSNAIVRRFSLENDPIAQIDYTPSTNTWTVLKEGVTKTIGNGGESIHNARKRHGIPGLRSTGGLQRPDSVGPFPGTCISSVPSPCNTAEWYLSSVSDMYGHTVKYFYVTSDLPDIIDQTWSPLASTRENLLKTILWTRPASNLNGEITFEYGDRPDPRMTYQDGNPLVVSKRLLSIAATVNQTQYSRYKLRYEDQQQRNCEGSDVVIDEFQRLTLLQRIVRVDVDSELERTMRCIDRSRQQISQSQWGGRVFAGTDLAVLDMSQGNHLIPLNIDGDGRSDLLYVNKRYANQHKVLVRTNSSQNPFRSDENRRGVRVWNQLLESVLTNNYLHDKHGWIISDFNRDGFSDLLHAELENTSNPSKIRIYSDRQDYFYHSPQQLSHCDLKFASAVDIDGDGFTDLAIKPHANDDDCGRESHGKWLRNMGRTPWFDPGTNGDNWQRLAVPHAGGLLLQGNDRDINVDGVQVEPPFGNQIWERPIDFVMAQARFVDVNSDGIADMTFSFHRTWRLLLSDDLTDSCSSAGANEKRCQWRAAADSEFSRIYLGDGYGRFIDTKLEAGTPTLGHRNGIAPYFTGYNQYLDINSSGFQELISSNDTGTLLRVHHYNGIAYGFNADAVDDANDSSTRLSPSPFPATPHPYAEKAGCNNLFCRIVLADFDGDGFTDVLQFRKLSSGTTSNTCGGVMGICVTMRYSRRDHSEGRVITSTGPWGGQTSLQWNYIGDTSMNFRNEHMTGNPEVLSSVVDADGIRSLAYENAVFDEGQFRGFTIAQYADLNGAKVTQAVSHSKLLSGRPVYTARYRRDGSLQRADVYVYGHFDDQTGYSIATELDGFNPLIRTCNYEIEQPHQGNRTQIGELISDCWGWQRTSPAHSTLLALSSRWRYSSNSTLNSIFWNPGAYNSESMPLYSLSEGTQYESDWITSQPISMGSPQLRWSSQLAMPEPINPEQRQALRPLAVTGNGYKRYVTDVAWDSISRQPGDIVEHRDTTTVDDDRIRNLEWDWNKFASGYQKVSDVMFNQAGVQEHSMNYQKFNTFDDPLLIYECAEGGKNCHEYEYRYDKNGDTLGVSNSTDKEVENWEYSSLCGVALYTDSTGKEERTTYDSLCRMSSRSSNGIAYYFNYDGFHRLVLESVVQDALETENVTRTLYDDVFTEVQDSKYNEPRMVSISNNAVTAEFMDDFGRATRTIVCESKTEPGAGDEAIKYDCIPGSTRIVSEYLYASNGMISISFKPYFLDTETPAYDVTLAWDETANPSEVYLRNPDASNNERWNRHLIWQAPGRTLTKDALDRTQREDHSTLFYAKQINGENIEQRTFDHRDRLINLATPSNGEYSFEYDELSRLKSWQRVGMLNQFETGRNVVSQQGFSQTYRYTDRDLVQSIVHSNGAVTSFRYDGVGRKAAQNYHDPVTGDRLSQSWQYEDKPDEGVFTTIHTDSMGGISSKTVDSLNRIMRQSYPEGHTVEYGIDTKSRQITTRISGGDTNSTRVEKFDVNGFLVETSQSGLPDRQFKYSGDGQLVRELTSNGSELERKYNPTGQLLEETLTGRNGKWLIQGFEYDRAGRPSQIRRAGSISQFKYDALDRAVEIQEGEKPSLRIQFNEYKGASDRLVSQQIVLGKEKVNSTQYAYDDWGRLNTTRDIYGESRTWKYDVDGNTREYTDENGVSVAQVVDSIGLLRSRTESNGVETYFEYERNSSYRYLHNNNLVLQPVLIVSKYSGDGSASKTVLDSANRVVATTSPFGVMHEYVYNDHLLSDVWLLSTVPATTVYQRTHYQYDSVGRLTNVYGADHPASFPGNPSDFDTQFTGTRITQSFDNNGNLVSISQNGNHTYYEYDSNGLLVSETHDGVTRSFNYKTPDRNGLTPLLLESLVETGANDESRQHTFSYDAMGRVQAIESQTGRSFIRRSYSDFDYFGNPRKRERSVQHTVTSLSHSTNETWQYDAYGRPLIRTIDTSGAAPRRTEWEWHANGLLKLEQAPGGAKLTYQYDFPNSDRLVSVNSSTGDVIEALEFNDLAQPLVVAANNFLYSNTYQAGGRRLSTEINSPNGRNLSNLMFDYRGDGKVQAQNFNSDEIQYIHEYSYNGSGFLSSETINNNGNLNVLDYDLAASGERLTTNKNGQVNTSIVYAPNSNERILSVNQIELEYNSWFDITEDQRGYQYERDAASEIARVSNGPLSVEFLRDASGQVVASKNSDGNTTFYDWRLGLMELPMQTQQLGANGVSFNTVHLSALGADLQIPSKLDSKRFHGTVRNTANSLLEAAPSTETSIMSAFGEIISGDVDATKSGIYFAGLRAYNAIPGVYFSHHRAYDSQTGQFLRTDPTGLMGGVNRRMYANADPVSFFDPAGYWACAIEPFDGSGLNLDDMLDDILNRFDIPDMEFGSGNIQYDITQMELAMGLEPVDFSWLADIDLTGGPDVCANIHCDGGDFPGPPEGDDISPMFNAASIQAKEDRKKRKDQRKERRSDRKADRELRRAQRKADRQFRKDMRRWRKIQDDHERNQIACENNNESACIRANALMAWYFEEGKRPKTSTGHIPGSRDSASSSSVTTPIRPVLDIPRTPEDITKADDRHDVIIDQETGDVSVRQYTKTSVMRSGVYDYDRQARPYQVEPPRTETTYHPTEIWEVVFNFKEKPHDNNRAKRSNQTIDRRGPLTGGIHTPHQPSDWNISFSPELLDFVERYGPDVLFQILKKLNSGPAALGPISKIPGIGRDVVDVAEELSYCLGPNGGCSPYEIERQMEEVRAGVKKAIEDSILPIPGGGHIIRYFSN